ncbi:hypothetical protein Dimus_036841 [Dionaea muscipula]
MTVIHLKKKDVVKSSVKGVVNEFDHLKLASILGIPGNNEIWTGENRRRDDDDDEASAEEEQEEVEARNDFDWEAVIDEAVDQGDSGLGEKFYDVEDEVQESTEVNDEVPAVTAQASA